MAFFLDKATMVSVARSPWTGEGAGSNFSPPAPRLVQLTKQCGIADYLVFLIVQSKKFQKIAGDSGLSFTFWMLLDHALMSGNWNSVAP